MGDAKVSTETCEEVARSLGRDVVTTPKSAKGEVQAVASEGKVVAWIDPETLVTAHDDECFALLRSEHADEYRNFVPVVLHTDYAAALAARDAAVAEREEMHKAALDWKAIAGDEFRKREAAERERDEARALLREARHQVDARDSDLLDRIDKAMQG